MSGALLLHGIAALVSLQCFASAWWLVWRYRQQKALERRLIAEFVARRRLRVEEHFLRIEDGEARDTIPDKPPIGFRG